MHSTALEDALQMARRHPVFVATADARGLPHMASAGGVSREGERSVLVTEWFCPGTMDNLEANPRVAVVVWDEENDRGYQLLGRVSQVEQTGVLDGYGPDVREDIPQVQRRLVVHVDTILDFSRAPHTDMEEE